MPSTNWGRSPAPLFGTPEGGTLVEVFKSVLGRGQSQHLREVPKPPVEEELDR
ncbi:MULTISPECIES: hypothetical protein [Streptomyces]|uniref:hypothetical protein n=1 Tax=Streptomyces TaxID=1883 RepID=UPI000AAB931F|nr:hypothetical protein [Streptomyces sp. NRRL S-146]